jgi:hypothetical protein
MSNVLLKLKYTGDKAPAHLFSKEEAFTYFDNVFDFFSKPRNTVDHMLFDLYLSKFRTHESVPAYSITTCLDNDTLRGKRVTALGSKINTATASRLEETVQTVKPEDAKESKESKYWDTMKLPAWASHRTRELRAKMLGLSLDEV